jgi:hypothetical protein
MVGSRCAGRTGPGHRREERSSEPTSRHPWPSTTWRTNEPRSSGGRRRRGGLRRGGPRSVRRDDRFRPAQDAATVILYGAGSPSRRSCGRPQVSRRAA